MSRLLVAVACALSLVLLGTGSALAKSTMPPTLSGETLTGTSITSDCTWTSPTSFTSTWTVSGTASGPYPGTFTETGTITNPTSGVLSGGASFQIVTDTRQTITGTKTMAHQTQNTGTSCQPGYFAGLSATENEFDYVARISTGKKSQDACDSGLSSLNLGRPAGTPYFQETFTSSQAATTRCPKKS